MKTDLRSRQGMVLLASALLAVPFLLGQGCPGYVGGTGAPVVVIHSPSLHRTASSGELITLVYDVTNPAGGTIVVSAFYDRDGMVGTGDEVAFGTNLASGTNKFTQLATASLADGPLYVGITATNSAGTTTAYATGVVTLIGGPSLTFLSPAGEMRVGTGTQVPVRIETGLTNYNYSVFYDGDGMLDGDEITIAGGTGSATSTIETTLNTAGLSPRMYYVGTTVTSSAGLSTSAYAAGTVSVVTGAFIQVLAPTIGLMVTPGDFVQVIIAANDPDQPTAMVRVFYDPDNIFDNGNETQIAQIPQTASGSSWDTRNIPVGNYYIGAELQNGLTTPLYSYSAGPVMLGTTGEGDVDETLLNVTTPLIPSTVLDGSVFRINWTTVLQPGEGTVTVFREPDADDDGEPDGEATRVNIVEGLDASIQFVDLDTSGLVGKFFIGATATESLTGATLTDYAEGTLTVILKVFWVGDLDTRFDDNGMVIHQTGWFQGAAFRGYNFGDNLGSAMIHADDYDGDGRNEIVLAAQFAKPFLIQSGGRGAGEAYMIYGAAQRYQGNYNVNNVGDASLPGVIFSGIIPNPYPGTDPQPQAKAGRSIPYSVEGLPAGPYDTEGLRSLTLIPDQDNDGMQEIVFGFPYCNSYSLWNQRMDGVHPAPLLGLGRLENNGHFLRGGIVIVSSTNPLLNDRSALSRHYDRALQLHEVGQVFDQMALRAVDNLPTTASNCDPDDDDTVEYPIEGFYQSTRADGSWNYIDPPRLAGVEQAGMWAGGLMLAGPPHDDYNYCWDTVYLDQIDPPADVMDVDLIGARYIANEDCEPNVDDGPPFGYWPEYGFVNVLGTGFYCTGGDDDEDTPTRTANRVLANARPPYGCRIVGQTTCQCPSPPNCLSTADRFGFSVSLSDDFLLIGAPTRTADQSDVLRLPSASRRKSGTVYMLQLKRPGVPYNGFMWSAPRLVYVPPEEGDEDAVGQWVEELVTNPTLAAPHNFVIEDLGYWRHSGSECYTLGTGPGDASFEVRNPFHIVGARPDDQVGTVTGLHNINNQGPDDFAVAAPGAFRLPHESIPRGVVYVIYRRQPEIEGDYLLEDLERDPYNDPNRLNGLMIVGEEGENIGDSLGGGGPLNDDYNDDGYADLLIGSPEATTAGGVHSGEVFILFGGRNLLSPEGGTTIAELRAAGDGMLIIGANGGDRAGMTVANAGDFNGDNVPDILIAAPNASPRFDSDGDGNPDTIGLDLDGDGVADDLNIDGSPDDMTGAGVAYVVFGGEHLTGTISLSLIGTKYLPGVTIIGRKAGDAMGGGLTQNGLLSRGVAPAGDVDGDGRADVLVSAIQADPEGKTNAGEVYLVYGFRP